MKFKLFYHISSILNDRENDRNQTILLKRNKRRQTQRVCRYCV